MSSVDEIKALREELANKRAARKEAEDKAVSVIRQDELDKEAERLRREIAEEDAVAQLLAAAGQNPEASEVTGTVRTDEEILAAHDAAVAAVTGEPVQETKTEGSPAKEDASSAKSDASTASETPKLTGGSPALSVPSSTQSAATTEQEK